MPIYDRSHEVRRLFSNRGHWRPGPKGPTQELIKAIVELKQRNPRYGCPRIAYIITLTFGNEINKDIVRRILAKHYKPKPDNTTGPSWLSFLGHSKDSLWSIDLFRCESLKIITTLSVRMQRALDIHP